MNLAADATNVDNDDITPEDYNNMVTPLGDNGSTDTDDDMDVIGGMNTPFGGPQEAPVKIQQVPSTDIDGVDDIENIMENDLNDQENNQIANEINNDIVTIGGPNDNGDIQPPNAFNHMKYLSKAQQEHVKNDSEDDILNDINTGTPMGLGMGGINPNDEGSSDADYALEDELIIVDENDVTLIDNADALRAKSLKQQEDFGQILGDDVMAQDLVMDDIVNDMNADGDDDDDELLAGMDTAQ